MKFPQPLFPCSCAGYVGLFDIVQRLQFSVSTGMVGITHDVNGHVGFRLTVKFNNLADITFLFGFSKLGVNTAVIHAALVTSGF